MKTVYLAGPITGCTYAGCTDWRKHLTNLFALAEHYGPGPDARQEVPGRMKRVSATTTNTRSARRVAL